MSKQAFLFLLLSFIFMSVSLDAFAQTCAAPPVGLTDFYPGDNSANDFVGTNHGTLANGANFTDSGKVGAAFNLDGADDFVNVASSVNLGSMFSVEFLSLSDEKRWLRASGF